MKTLAAAGSLNDCITEPKRIEQLRILRWVIAYTGYCIAGHIPPPDPRSENPKAERKPWIR